MPHQQITSHQLSFAQRLRSSMSEAEKRLWYRLRAPSFRRQCPIGPYIVDFVCHETKLIIELDGGQHASAALAKRDAWRSSWLESQGYRVRRFWNNDVLSNLDGVLELIAAELESPPSRLVAARRADLPHKGGGYRRAAL